MTYFEKTLIENFAEIKIAGVCLNQGSTSFGGYGATISQNGIESNIFGGSSLTTKNQMELMACIKALEFLSELSSVNLYTNSYYLLDGITKWINGWKKNGWLTKSGEHVKNKNLWLELEKLVLKHKINWKLTLDVNPQALELAEKGKEAEKIKYKELLKNKKWQQ
jgi:ribonuclease HI